jgi:hypothetical protein
MNLSLLEGSRYFRARLLLHPLTDQFFMALLMPFANYGTDRQRLVIKKQA